MDGAELFARAVSTVQEIGMKIGDASGSISLYYPFEGDPAGLESGFMEASIGVLKNPAMECLPGRVTIIISEEDCRRILKLPAKESMKDTVSLIGKCAGIEEFRGYITDKYPGAAIRPSSSMEFDWILTFPKEVDADIYCISEEMGRLTYHRFSEEEYRRFGFGD